MGSNMKSNRVTLKDISEKTGYSINTISRALKDKDEIPSETRKYIKKIANELGYVMNNVASALRSGETKTIAVILGDISNPHFAINVKEIESYANSHGYNIIIINTEEDPEREYKAIISAIEKQVDGIIICPTQRNKKNIKFLNKTGIPFVLFGRRFQEINTDYVVCDDVKGGYLATTHLIKKGKEKILFLKGPEYISSSKERLEGYKKALQENNLPMNDNLIYEVSIKAGGCKKVLSQILEKDIKFTGIFAFSDMIAMETIYLLNENGYEVPAKFSVVGYDNIQSSLFFPVKLTSISTKDKKMSIMAIKFILKKIKNKNMNFEEVVDVKLVERETG